MSATEVFANQPFGTVTSGPTDPPPVSGTNEIWTVFQNPAAPFPSATTDVSQFHITDTDTTAASEIILVTNIVSTTWYVTRGAEGTTPVSHELPFTVTQVLTAGWLSGLVSGVNAVDNGGTGLATAAAYAVLAGGTSSTSPFQQVSGLGSSGQVLTSQGAGSLPSWTSQTGLVNPMTTHGDTIYENAALAPAALAGNVTSTKNFLTSTGSGGTANSPAWGTIAAADVPTLNQNTTGTASNVSGTVATTHGGTGLGSITSYAVVTGGTSSTAALQTVASAGAAGQVLTSNGAGSLPSFKAAPVDWINVVTGYGADPSGSADSTAAIQSAVTAALALSSSVSAGGITAAMLVPTVYFPQGNYLISSALTFGSQTSLIRMTGNWGSRIFSNASGIIDFQNIANQGLEVDHLTLDATGGHVFTNPALKFCYFHHLNLIQRSATYAIIDLEQSGGAMQECAWTDIQTWALADPVAGTRSTATVKLYPQQGATVAGTTFERWQCNNYPGTGGSGGTRDSTQYCFDLACTDAGTSSWVTNITFSHITFNHYFGGCIKVRSGANIRILGCKPDNLSTDAGVSWANAAIYIGKDGGAVSKGVRIHDYQRGSGALPTPGSEPSDIYTESTTADIMVDGATDSSSATPTGPQVNLNGAAGAIIRDADPSLTVLNPAADTIRINAGTITTGALTARTPLAVTSGGTGGSAVTSYAVVTGGTSSTAALQQVSGVGGSGQTLVSQGAAALPQWGPVSGQFLSTYRYNPTTQTGFPVSSTTPAAFGSGTIATQAFTAPPSGNVLVTMNFMLVTSSAGVYVAMYLSPHGSVTTISSDVIQYESPASGFSPQQGFPFMLTGLNPGTSYNYDLIGSCTSGQSGTIVAYTQTSYPPSLGTTALRGGPVVVTIQAV